MTDPCSLLFVVFVFLAIGQKVVASDAAARQWSGRCALLAFLLAGAGGLQQEGAEDVSSLAGIILRSLAAAGLVLGAGWIALPVVFAAGRHMRSAECRMASQRRQRLMEKEQARKKAADEKAAAARDAEWERTRPERERQTQEAAERAEAERRSQRAAQARRTDTRAACELLYTLHAPEIRKRFPREKYDAFVRIYMTDGHDASEVERRGTELQALIREHLQQAKPQERPPQSIQELCTWFLEQEARINSLQVPDEMKQTHLLQLRLRYEELTQQLFEKGSPCVPSVSETTA